MGNIGINTRLLYILLSLLTDNRFNEYYFYEVFVS